MKLRQLDQLLLVLLLSATLQPIYGQLTIADDGGYKPYGSFDVSEFDKVNMSNFALKLDIPLGNFPQRGGRLNTSFTVDYTPNSFSYDIVPCDTDDSGQCVDESYFEFFWNGGGIGVHPSFGYSFNYEGYLTDTNGNHPLAWVGDRFHAYTTDGTGYQLIYPSNCQTGANVLITAKDGTQAGLPCSGVNTGSYIRDANGNQLTYQSNGMTITDTFGRSFSAYGIGTATNDFSGCTGQYETTSATVFTLPGANGSSLSYKFCQPNAPNATYYVNCSDDNVDAGGPYQGCPGPIPHSLGTGAQSIVLPDGTAYTFEYDNYASQAGASTYGDLTKITLPTGGTISYTWTDLSLNGDQMGYMKGFSFTRALSSRTVDANDGSGPHRWLYTQAVIPSVAPYVQSNASASTRYSMAVTDPDNNDTVHTFIDQNSGLESSTQYYQGSYSTGTLLKEERIDYSFQAGEHGWIGIQPMRVTTVWGNGETIKTETDYDTAISYTTDGITGQTINSYISLGLVMATRVFDYGAGSPGPLLRSTATRYLWQDNSNYLTANLVTLPSAQCTSTSLLSGCSSSTGSEEYTLFSYDESPSPSGLHGNATTVKHWLNTDGSYLTSSAVYNSVGMPTSVTRKGVNANFTYDGTGLFLSEVDWPTINGVAHKEWFTSDPITGAVLSYTDQNGTGAGDPKHTTTGQYDSFGRLTKLSYPDGGGETIVYNDGANSSVQTTVLASPSGNQTSVVLADGLGRRIDSQVTSVPGCAGGVIHSTVSYDELGRTSLISNPFCSTTDSTYANTQFTYDVLGRQTQVIHSDSSRQKVTYSGDSTVVAQDESQNQWRRISDGLGRVKTVQELGSSGSPLNLETDYSYDARGNLLGVTQLGNGSEAHRTRSFTYDSLARLLTANNPESGLTTYYPYDANGNRRSLTDARGVKISYSYDALNRLTQKSYSDGTPSAVFRYDETADWAAGGCTNGSSGYVQCNTIGRLSSTATSDNLTGRIYGYDALGRTTMKATCVGMQCGRTEDIQFFSYDLAGNQTAYDHGQDSASGAFFGGHNIAYDNAGRLQTMTAFQDATSPTTVYSALSFGAAGLLTSELGNGLTESRSYDPRLRQTSYSVSSSVPVYSWGLQFYPNNNVSSGSDSLNGNYTYQYDSVNRLSSATSSNASFQWTYDSFGNRLSQVLTGGTGTTRYDTYSTGTNRPDGVQFDQAGNAMSDGSGYGVSLQYDGESRLKSAGGVTYLYDAEGERVAKYAGGSLSSAFLFDLRGRVVTELDNNFNVRRREVYALGRHLGSYDQSGTFTYALSDWLNTERVRTSSSAEICEAMTSQPFGDNQQVSGSCSTSPAFFTGKERDTESSLDQFGARFYGSIMGRFTRPDWSAVGDAVPYAVLGNPQTLNLFAYVTNNPVSAIDPDGHAEMYATNDGGADPCADQGQCSQDEVAGAAAEKPKSKKPWMQIWQHSGGGAKKTAGPIVAGLGSGGGGDGGSAPPPPGGSQSSRPRGSSPNNGFVLAQTRYPVPTAKVGGRRGREVDYEVFALGGDGRLGLVNHNVHINLLETLLSGNLGARGQICSSVAICPGYDRMFEDDQAVFRGSPFTIKRQWFVNGNPIRVWNPSTSMPASFEILHLQFESEFVTEYVP